MTTYLIKDIDMLKGYANATTMQTIYNHLNISRSQAIDMCILMGTNHNKTSSRVGPKTTIAEIRRH